MTYKIFRATAADADELAVLVNSAYRGDSSRKGWTTEADLLDGTRTDADAITTLINSPNTILLKYVEDSTIKGCVQLQHTADGLYLGMLTVQPDLQGKGIGKILLNASEEEARRQQCAKVVMSVISLRHELIDWYVRHGYQDSGKRKPFAFSDPRFGQPKQPLEFVVLEKNI
jgi:ribosomal protein S18 acetylase RimI-like enzyme